MRSNTLHHLVAIALVAVSLANCGSGRDTIVTAPVINIEMDTVEVVPEKRIYRPTEKKVHDLLHTRLDVSFDWAQSRLNGLARLTLRPWFYPSDRLVLDAKGMDIHSVMLQDSMLVELPFEYDGQYLDIDLKRKYSRFEKFTIEIDYTAKPEELNVKGSAAITDAKGLYFINPDSSDVNKPTQVWTQGQTEASSCWFPTIDTPAERMTQEIFITVRKDFQTLSNGTLIYTNYNDDDTRTDYWKMEQEHPPYLTMLAAGDFVIANDMYNKESGEEIPVTYYLERDYAPYAYKIFGNTPEMIRYYSDLLGFDYPWDKYAQIVVRDYVSGAMENTTAVIHGEFVQGTDRELIDYNAEDVIAHELFHHWFGDLVTCESWSHLPLNESFATYGEVLWEEFKYGQDAADFHAYESNQGYFYEAQYQKKPLIRFDYDDKEDMFDAHSYNKGGAILHMLRETVGDSAFFTSLNHYLHQNAFKDAETDNLRIAFEEITGLDLNWFFDQWFFGAGHPDLSASFFWDDEQKEQQIVLTQTQDLEVNGVFTLPMTIALHYEDGEVAYEEVIMNEQEQLFRFPSEKRPVLVRLDANEALLVSESYDMPEEWWPQLLDASFPFRTRKEAVNYANDLPKERYRMLETALLDPFWNIRRSAVRGILEADSLSQLSEARMMKLLETEEHTATLGSVINALSELKPELLSKEYLIQRIDKDLSYRVNAAALEALAIVDFDLALEKANNYADAPKSNMIIAIAEVYTASGNAEYAEYFERMIRTEEAYNAYGVIQSYGSFISALPDASVERALDLVEEIHDGDGVWWLNIANYRMLGSIIDRYRDPVNEGQFTSPTGDRAYALLQKFRAEVENSTLVRTLNEIE